MLRPPLQLVAEFVAAFADGDVRRLEPFLDPDVVARFEDAGQFVGRRALLDFWRRIFLTYARIDLRISKMIADQNLVIAELHYAMAPRQGTTTFIRTISLFDVENEGIVFWTDNADLSEIAASERGLWLRLGRARW